MALIGEGRYMQMGDWTDLASTVLNIGADIYKGTVQAKAAKRAIKASASDFPQLGLGLAATGPQRASAPNPFYTPDSPLGRTLDYFGFGESSMPDSAVSVRAPTQYIVYTTPTGRQRVTGVRGLGTPLLWSGDLAAVRRVARVARKLGRFVRHRPR